jgi:Ca-activated chloride channel family protein
MKHLSGASAALIALTLCGTAAADAVLESPAGTLFPTDISIEADVRAQVETTTIVLTFPALTVAGDHVLTVPSPRGAYSVGVDVDQGQGFVRLPIAQRAPPPGAGSGPGASAALRAWQGSTPLLASLDRLQPGPLSVRVRFLRLLRRHQGRVSFEVGADRCPLRDSAVAPPTVSLSARVRTFRAMASLFTQGAAPKITKPSSTEALLALAPTTLAGSVRTTINYEEQGKGIQLGFLAHRTPSADPLKGSSGYFLLLLDADTVAPELSPPRTLNLVIDRSGSMQGGKIEQARLAALAMLDNLQPDDKINLHSFNDQVDSWQSGPVLADPANLAAAKSFISALGAGGSTDLDAAITTALGGTPCGGAAPDPRYDALILLSDGLPTAGITDSAKIYHRSMAYNCEESRIFTFAVGQGADVALLEAIARSSRGRNFILNDSQATTELAEAVRELFEDIYAVRVTDLSVTLDGIQAHDVLPEKPTDLFNGGQVVVVGRYRDPGKGAVQVTGDAGGVPFARTVPVQAPGLIDDNEAIKYVWATEMVGKLLADMARGGDVAELEQRITELGMGYSIQTPFTSFATPSAPPATGGGGSGGGGTGGGGGSSPGSYSGGGGSSGGWGGGDVDPLVLLALLGLAPLVWRRRSRSR